MILLVDDDPDIIKLLSGVLDSAGLAHVAAASGTEGLELARRHLPELVILDVQMPGLDGFDTFRALRKVPAMEDVPILFLSASGSDGDVIGGFDLGAEDYLTKPFNAVQLLAKVRSILQRFRRRPAQSYRAFRPNAVIDRRFKVISQLGQGGMASVYRVADIQTDEQFALKVLHGAGMATEHAIERFEREVEVMRELNHPNLVKLYHAKIDAQLCYFTMDYVSGATLRDELERKGVIRVTRALAVCELLADALAAIHAAGSMHRDVKPQNILFDARGTPLLTDFGLVVNPLEDQDRLTRTGVLMGTPRYMSPEQVKAPRDLDYRSDIYQLGVVLHEMLTGQTPFEDLEDFEAMFAAAEREIPPPQALDPTLPSIVVDVVLGALANDRESRFQSAKAMATAARTAIDMITGA